MNEDGRVTRAWYRVKPVSGIVSQVRQASPVEVRIKVLAQLPSRRVTDRCAFSPNADLFHIAHRHLSASTGVDGPLTWRPGLLPELIPGESSVEGEDGQEDEAAGAPLHGLHLTDSAPWR